MAGLLPDPLASENVGNPTRLLSLIFPAFPHPALWNTLLLFEATNGAPSGDVVFAGVEDLAVFVTAGFGGDAANAVIVAECGQGNAVAVLPCPFRGTMSIAMAQWSDA